MLNRCKPFCTDQGFEDYLPHAEGPHCPTIDLGAMVSAAVLMRVPLMQAFESAGDSMTRRSCIAAAQSSCRGE